ncbi:DNA pilot protein [Antarctic microvirus TYR_006_V_25]|nr:DNA pilot protein [Antarctic microvirus TYR_006_V_25]
MPLSALAAAGISLGGNLVSQAIGASNSRRSQNHQFDLQQKSYGIQRADALSDRSFENEYNSPAEQMKRLQAAGLNPNLVYGGAQSTPQSSSTRQSSGQAPNENLPAVPALGSDFIAAFMDAQRLTNDTANKTAQTNLLIQQGKTSETQAALNEANLLYTNNRSDNENQETRKRKRENYIGDQLTGTSIEFKKAELDKLMADTAYTLDNNERAAALQGQTIRESVERILNLRESRANTAEQREVIKQQRINLAQDERIKKMDERLSKTNLSRNDPYYIKMVNLAANGIVTLDE